MKKLLLFVQLFFQASLY